MEDKALHAEQAKLPGEASQFIGLFLHAVADIDEGPDGRLGLFGADMAQHAADLGRAAHDRNFRHGGGEPGAVAQEGARPGIR